GGVDDGGVHGHDLTVGVEQGPTGVARVDGRVGLDEVVEGDVLGLDAPIGGRDDPLGHARRAAQVEGVADGDHVVADLHVGRHPQLGRGQPAGVVDADQGDVVVGQAAHQ